MKVRSQYKPAQPIISECKECGKETRSKGRKPRYVCQGKRDRTGKYIYSECELAYWARWKRNNRRHYKKGGKYYKTGRLQAPEPKPKPKREERVCLGVICNGEKTFMSTGPYNRICENCQTSIEGYNDTRVMRIGTKSHEDNLIKAKHV